MEKRNSLPMQKGGVDGIIFQKFAGESIVFCRSIESIILPISFRQSATSDERIQNIDEVIQDFSLCTTTGVTGRSDIGDIGSYVKRVKLMQKRIRCWWDWY